MRVPNIQVPPVGMRVPITPKDLVAPDSVPRKKPQEESKGELDMNVQDELKALKQRIAELEQQAEQEKEFPQDGDEYWFIDTTDDVCAENWHGFSFEIAMLEIGNVFKTKEQAEFAVEKLKVENELQKFSDSWDLEITQYTFSFDWECGELKIEYPDYNQYPNSYYFYSADDLQQAIESVGRGRIKKYIFGIGD